MSEIPQSSDRRNERGLAAVAKLPLLPAILSSLGAVGALTAVGYVVQSSRDRLLGINLVTSHPTTDYVSLGGQFLLDTVTATWLHWPAAAITALLATSFGLVAAWFLQLPKTITIQRIVWMATFVLLTVVYVVKSRRLDLPYIRMSDLLEKPPVCEKVLPGQQRIHDVWERFMCSRDDDTLHTAIKEKVYIDCGNVPGALVNTPTPQKPTNMGVARLREKLHTSLSIENEYTINIFVTAFLAFVALMLCIAPALASIRPITAGAIRLLLLTTIVADVITLPVVYGKVMLSTRFPSGRIMYDGIVADEETGALRSEPRNDRCLILASDENFVTFYDTEDNIFVQVKREKVYVIQARETGDLVADRITYFLQNSPCSGGS